MDVRSSLAVAAEPLHRGRAAPGVAERGAPPRATGDVAVSRWLWCMAALVFAMVVVGGATRLTQSGLSIVEWKPVTGVVPPLSEPAWHLAFDQYKTIPQYARLNPGMSLAAFKTIYWWEWGHRLLGRLIGVAFALPFLWFLWRGRVDRRLALALGGVFALGAVQAVVGWWMVASGLTERVDVSQYRLAFHLTLACVLYAALVWTAERVGDPGTGRAVPRRFAVTAAVLPGLVLMQIYLGALVAGLHAGLIYNTWPLIDGGIIPSSASLWFDRPAWRNLFENTLTVQFDHRMMAYTVAAVAVAHLVDVWRSGEAGLRSGAGLLAAAVLVQVLIGIATLVLVVPLPLALLHQATALVVLTAATRHACRALSPTKLDRIEDLGTRAGAERAPVPAPVTSP